MIITVMVCARSMIRKRAREPDVAILALIFGTGAAVFLVASFLYDAMTFPHGPYLFFTYAGLAAVLLGRSGHGDPTAPVRQRWDRKRRPDL
jgi:peptidoglycan/LPS O-acetylase OafA/YrhL